MEFCPFCTTMLQFEFPNTRPPRFACPACPYVCALERNVELKRKEPLMAKEVDPVVSNEHLSTLPTTEVPCANSKCDNGKAYFEQHQTRSADEPMTIYYTCVKCGHKWND